MTRIFSNLFLAFFIVYCLLMYTDCSSKDKKNINKMTIKLPEPKLDGFISVEKALENRRSRRNLLEDSLTKEILSQLLWSAQGITKGERFRTAPSAGALYPMELYVVVGNIKELPAGVYKYIPFDNTLVNILIGDIRKDLVKACLWQNFIEKAPLTIIISAVYERVTKKYGERGKTYVHMEAGHIGQNIYLQCESLNLGTVAVGAFIDDQVKNILKLGKDEMPLYIFPIGKYKIND